MWNPERGMYIPQHLLNTSVGELAKNIFDIQEILSLFPDFPALFDPNIEPPLINFHPQYFQEIKDATLALQAFDLTIPRTEWMQQQYLRFRKKLERYGVDMNEFIRGISLGNECFAILPDAFPYDVPSDTSHYDFWVGDPGVGNGLLAGYLGQFLTTVELTPRDVVIVEKPPLELRHPKIQPSVPGVRHIHLFVQKP